MSRVVPYECSWFTAWSGPLLCSFQGGLLACGILASGLAFNGCLQLSTQYLDQTNTAPDLKSCKALREVLTCGDKEGQGPLGPA